MTRRSIYRLDAFAVALTAILAGCNALPPRSGHGASPRLPPDAAWFRLDTEPYRGKQDDLFFVDRSILARNVVNFGNSSF